MREFGFFFFFNMAVAVSSTWDAIRVATHSVEIIPAYLFLLSTGSIAKRGI